MRGVFEKSAKHRYRSVCVLGTRAISHAQSLEPNRVINRDRCRDGRLALALVQGSGTSTRILTAPHLSQSQSTIFRAGVIAFDLRLRLGGRGRGTNQNANLGILARGAALSGCASSSALSLDWIYRADPSQLPHALRMKMRQAAQCHGFPRPLSTAGSD